MSENPTSPAQPGGGTGLLERTETVTPDYVYEPGDAERFAHYADKNKIMESRVFNIPVQALCGKVWVPQRDPEKFPVCPACKEVYDQMQPGDENPQE